MKCDFFTVFSTDTLLVYKSKYYLQGYLDNCAYKIAKKQMIDYLDENIFEDYVLSYLKELILLKVIELRNA